MPTYRQLLPGDAAPWFHQRSSVNPNDAFDSAAGSINRNADCNGGFPDNCAQDFKPPSGGARVFSCSLLHAVSKVTRGRRYTFLPFLPFLYDAAAKIRDASTVFLGAGTGAYRS
jgi:hypothetical protein